MPAIAKTLEQITPADEQRFGSLRFIPLCGDSASDPEYRLYSSETEEQVEVTEVSEGGSVPTLHLRNRLDSRVLLIDSQELIGLKQNRMVDVTKGLAGRRFLESHDCNDVTRPGCVDPLPLVRVHLKDAGRPLLALPDGIPHLASGFQHS